MTIAQTTMIAASLAILVYIAVIITGSTFFSMQGRSSLAEQMQAADSALHNQIANNFDYVHTADANRASSTILLNGINLTRNQYILLYDSTPYATKGHIALNLPCDANTPNVPSFQLLVGRAPNLTATALGYISQISAPPQMCIYHAQFGFGEPVTDVVLKNTSTNTVSFKGPHSVVITAHESYIPTTPSFMQLQHKQMSR
jgi:hypothetical protein